MEWELLSSANRSRWVLGFLPHTWSSLSISSPSCPGILGTQPSTTVFITAAHCYTTPSVESKFLSNRAAWILSSAASCIAPRCTGMHVWSIDHQTFVRTKQAHKKSRSSYTIKQTNKQTNKYNRWINCMLLCHSTKFSESCKFKNLHMHNLSHRLATWSPVAIIHVKRTENVGRNRSVCKINSNLKWQMT